MEAFHSSKHSQQSCGVIGILGSLKRKFGLLAETRQRSLQAMLEPEATDLENALRAAIVADGRTLYAIAKEAGLKQIQVARFVKGERTIGLPIAGRLCAVLGLELGPASKPTRKGGK